MISPKAALVQRLVLCRIRARACERRVLQLEADIGSFLAARDASEMSNEQAAIARLRLDMEEV
jgi:hypothetical protein